MKLHESTFGYLNPTDAQKERMNVLRKGAAQYAALLEQVLPNGPDKTHILRMHRQNAMWVNECVTREADGTPRKD